MSISPKCSHAHAPDDHEHPQSESHECCHHAHVAQAPRVSDAWVGLDPQQALSDGVRTPLRIMQMDCPTEEALIRKKLESVKGINAVQFNLMQRVLTVDHQTQALPAIVEAIRSLGFDAQLPDNTGRLVPSEPPRPAAWWPLGVAAAAALAAELSGWFTDITWLPAVLAMLAIAIGGLGTYKKGLTALLNRNLNINALMSIAVTGALALGQWPEAAMVMVLFAVAEFIEAKSLDRARDAITRLMQLAPESVCVQGGDGVWKTVPAAQVSVGSRVRAAPGERIGLDGVVLSGSSALNQAPITGESMPVDKTVDDMVYAGSINGMGELEYRVTAAFDHTLLARIIEAVQNAQGSKAPTQRFVDRFARIYTPIVCALALAVAVFPPLLLGQPWFDWIYRALVLLVIACPCALVISTPVAIVSGLAAAARHGILIKGGIYLEQGRQLAWLALDKTGTLTLGKPEPIGIVVTDASRTIAQCQQWAASLADRSDHPVSQAIARAHRGSLSAVQGFAATAGGGVHGTIDGHEYRLGAYRWIREGMAPDASLERQLSDLEEQGGSVTVLADATQVLAFFAVADTIRPSSRAAIAELPQLGVRTAMLSGDNAGAARSIAHQAGIDQVRSSLLPQDKLDTIMQYEVDGLVGMVGDGINDAPALARADIGFAMGAMGTDTAIETADVALMDDDLRKIPRFIRLSRATHAILVQNIAVALGIKAVFLALTVVGLGTMWMAVFADVGASLLVLANSLRLLKK